MDDSTAQAGAWTPEAVQRNARMAAKDETTIAYIGEQDSAASALSIPILNEAGILQVSPSNTFVGLTRTGPGAEPGEPERYYPSGIRTFGRIIPNDVVQARAAAALVQQLGRRRVLMVHDGSVYGRSIADVAGGELPRRGATVTHVRELTGSARNARRIARLARGADAVVYGGSGEREPQRLWRHLRKRRGLVKIASDGVAYSGFFDSREGGIGPRAARGTYVLVGTLAASAYPPAARDLLRSMGNPPVEALYGYESMSVILDAVERGGATQRGTIEGFFNTRDRDSVLGRYSIDANGDTTLTQYGVYRIEQRELVFDRAVDPGP